MDCNTGNLNYKITVRNKSNVQDPNVVAYIYAPAGMSIKQLHFTKGTWDVANSAWLVGVLAGNSSETATVELEITNAQLVGTSKLRVFINGQWQEVAADNNSDETDVVITGDPTCPTGPVYVVEPKNCPPPVAVAKDSIGAMLTGDVAYNDTLCSSGRTEWRVVPGSETNVTLLFFDKDTGKYIANAIDITQSWTFQYGIYCIDECLNCPGGNEYGPFNVVTVTGPALMSCLGIAPCATIFTQADLTSTPCPTPTPAAPDSPPLYPTENDVHLVVYNGCKVYYKYSSGSWAVTVQDDDGGGGGGGGTDTNMALNSLAQTAAILTHDFGNNQQFWQDLSQWTVVGGSFSQTLSGSHQLEAASISLDSTSGSYIMLTDPPIDNTLTEWIVRDSGTGELSRRQFNPCLESQKVTQVTSDYTILVTDMGIEVDASGGDVTLTLPAPTATWNVPTTCGQVFNIKVVDATNQVDLVTPSGVIVDSQVPGSSLATYAFSGTGEVIRVRSNGVNYVVL